MDLGLVALHTMMSLVVSLDSDDEIRLVITLNQYMLYKYENHRK